jgi:hypothetical protein
MGKIAMLLYASRFSYALDNKRPLKDSLIMTLASARAVWIDNIPALV